MRPDWLDSLVLYRSAVARHLPDRGSVLDLGCGHASWLAPELAAADVVVGADTDLHALRRNPAPPGGCAGRGPAISARVRSIWS